MAECHDPTPEGSLRAASALPQPAPRLIAGVPWAAAALAAALGVVAVLSFAWITISPFDAAAFGGLTVPIVLRLTGTNEEIAMKILTENGFSAMTDMDDAVQRAVKLATGGQAA